MKKSKKLLALLLSLVMIAGLAACGGGNQGNTETPSGNTETPGAETPSGGTVTDSAGSILNADGTFEIAMITDKGDINDKSFNQGTWEGILTYCQENGKTCKYYKPVDATTDDYVAAMEQAIADGAKVVVTPGFLFEEPVYIVQENHPDVKFVLIDGNPHNADYSDFKTADNTVGILFSEEQVGYLAGYAAVKDGYTKLGFFGGQPVPAVIRYGYGYVQGANDAAKELGITVDMRYFNTDGFDATPEAQTRAASWYTAGTEIVFGCGGSVGNSVMAAAEQNGGLVIGVDVDQSTESSTVVSSAMKGLSSAVEQMLDSYYNDNFSVGGQNLTLGAAEDAVKLPMDTSKWETFTQADYDALFAKLANGEITLQKDTDADGNPIASPADLGCTNVNVTVE
nr:BMP family ABC transporter substrate-binding protein [uncultured Flavonifractor sp.]